VAPIARYKSREVIRKFDVRDTMAGGKLWIMRGDGCRDIDNKIFY
jgi:hypothetical protein